MANMPSTNKRFVGVLLPLEVVAQLRKEAAMRKMTLSDLLEWILQKELEDVELTSEDYRWIANEVAKNEARRRGHNAKKSR